MYYKIYLNKEKATVILLLVQYEHCVLYLCTSVPHPVAKLVYNK